MRQAPGPRCGRPLPRGRPGCDLRLRGAASEEGTGWVGSQGPSPHGEWLANTGHCHGKGGAEGPLPVSILVDLFVLD